MTIVIIIRRHDYAYKLYIRTRFYRRRKGRKKTEFFFIWCANFNTFSLNSVDGSFAWVSYFDPCSIVYVCFVRSLVSYSHIATVAKWSQFTSNTFFYCVQKTSIALNKSTSLRFESYAFLAIVFLLRGKKFQWNTEPNGCADEIDENEKLKQEEKNYF